MRVALPSYDAKVDHLFCIVPELSVTQSGFSQLPSFKTTLGSLMPCLAQTVCVSEIVLHVTDAAYLLWERKRD